MNKILLVSTLSFFLAGCNTTIRPAVDVYVPTPRPYYDERPRVVIAPVRPRCATVWDRTRYGYVERKICGNHIP